LCFKGLMVEDSSPVKDYYPIDFETDLNGKLQEWEAVVLIPFIDEVAEFILVLMMVVVVVVMAEMLVLIMTMVPVLSTFWNDITLSVKQSPSLGSFKRNLKTHYFANN